MLHSFPITYVSHFTESSKFKTSNSYKDGVAFRIHCMAHHTSLRYASTHSLPTRPAAAYQLDSSYQRYRLIASQRAIASAAPRTALNTRHPT
jgi:hypothetical protein